MVAGGDRSGSPLSGAGVRRVSASWRLGRRRDGRRGFVPHLPGEPGQHRRRPWLAGPGGPGGLGGGSRVDGGVGGAAACPRQRRPGHRGAVGSRGAGGRGSVRGHRSGAVRAQPVGGITGAAGSGRGGNSAARRGDGGRACGRVAETTHCRVHQLQPDQRLRSDRRARPCDAVDPGG